MSYKKNKEEQSAPGVVQKVRYPDSMKKSLPSLKHPALACKFSLSN
jgi:hypothetical protein